MLSKFLWDIVWAAKVITVFRFVDPLLLIGSLAGFAAFVSFAIEMVVFFTRVRNEQRFTIMAFFPFSPCTTYLQMDATIHNGKMCWKYIFSKGKKTEEYGLKKSFRRKSMKKIIQFHTGRLVTL
jgi:hypothetical protein